MKTKPRYYAVTDIKWLQFLLHSRVTALAMHWTFQNMLNMDRTELSCKLILDIFLTLVFASLLSIWLPLMAAIIAGLLLAHTLNFLFNGQIFVVLKHFGDVSHELSEHECYLEAVKDRLRREPSIRWAAVYGSMTRGELKTTSDLDIRLIRYSGFINGIRACWFALHERSHAHLNRYPIDILVFDSPRLLSRLREDERPLVIYDAALNLQHEKKNYRP
jgi:predicted nucleotidyltransferase